jgi:hypothetical protein
VSFKGDMRGVAQDTPPPVDFLPLARTLANQTPNLAQLHVHEANVHGEPIALLCQGLEKKNFWKKLQYLHIMDCNMNNDDVARLAQAILTTKKSAALPLQDLDLSGNPAVGLEGAKWVVRLINRRDLLPELAQVDLSRCAIGDEGFMELVKSKRIYMANGHSEVTQVRNL